VDTMGPGVNAPGLSVSAKSLGASGIFCCGEDMTSGDVFSG